MPRLKKQMDWGIMHHRMDTKDPYVQDPGMSVRFGKRVIWLKRRSGGVATLEANVRDITYAFKGVCTIGKKEFEVLWRLTTGESIEKQKEYENTGEEVS